jgi:hypothetical protein
VPLDGANQWIFITGLLMWTGLGLLILITAGCFAIRKRSRLARASRTSGIIASYRAAADADGGENFYPLVRGHRPSGQPFEFESPVYGLKPEPPPGTQVEVLIDPERPDRLWISGHQWHWYTIPLMLGGFFLLSGLGLLAAFSFLRWLFPVLDGP